MTTPNPWARRLLDRAADADLPEYGSLAWEQLADDDPAKVAACVAAAEAWRSYWSPGEHRRRLQVEVATERAALEAAERADAERWARAAERTVDGTARRLLQRPTEPTSRPLQADPDWPDLQVPPGAQLVS